MPEPEPDVGVVLPESGDGRRSTTAFGKAAVAAAVLPVRPERAADAMAVTDWRRDYLGHFRGLVEAGAGSADDALAVARSGLAATTGRMLYASDGGERPLATALQDGRADAYRSVVVEGRGERGKELSLPYRGDRLTGDALLRRVDAWLAAGVLEPSAAEAVRAVVADPALLDLAGTQVAVLGAGAEMGPLIALSRWGADLTAVDLPRPELWERVIEVARRGAGRLTVPIHAAAAEPADDAALARSAGADLLVEPADLAAWLATTGGRLVLGNYVYADGVLNLRVSAAVDALSVEVLRRRSAADTALAFLATPTDVFRVPADVVEDARRRWRSVGPVVRLRGVARAGSGGRLFTPHYRRTLAGGGALTDALVPQQGPNYALAKRLQRWRGAVAGAEGVQVSLNVAPPTRTRSVLKNRALAAAYAGARRFGVEVFEPATSNTLMAALLAHDLQTRPSAPDHPDDREVQGAVHGGLWRQAYEPRSVLGLAVLVGLGGARA